MKKRFKTTFSLLLSMTILTTAFMGLKTNSAVALSVDEEEHYTCFTDDFNREAISGGNSGWIERRQTTANLISDGTLHLKDTSIEMIRGYAHDLVMRPMNEAALNQEVSVEINNLAQLPEANASANLHLRLTDTELMTVNGGTYPWYGESYYARVSSTKLQLHKTYARDTNKDMATALLRDSSDNNAVAEYNAVDGSHTFALVFTVTGSYPTTLTATLYDLTNSLVVASVQAVDSTPSLQGSGTAAISMCGGGTGLNKTAKLDNFEYRRTDSGLIYYDDFSKTDITRDVTSGGWIEQVEATGGTSSNFMGNTGTETKYTGMLRIVDGTGNGQTKNLVVRPMSQAAIDQKVGVTVANLGHIGYGGSSANIHARVTSTDAANTASYFASLGLKAFSVSKADEAGNETTLVANTYDSNLSDQPYRIELETAGTYPTTITARFYRISDNTLIDELTCTDYTTELQRPGTVGLSATKSSSSSERRGAFDGFLYEYPNASFYFDDFGRKNITVSDQNASTGWIEQLGTDTKNYIGTGSQDHNGRTFSQGTLIITGTGTAVGYKRNLVMRPMSEAAVNQKAEVTIFGLGDHFVSSQAGASANLHLRVTATDAKYATSYFVSAQDGYLRICKMVSPDGVTDAKLQEIKKVE
ncbi:MAG: hypothetical protein J6B93_01095 [Clostridia bacterium]|nr:hypothetical protein [Clostridia bacterium]